ncbi:pyrimidine utilization protein D [Azorhizobium sp. AG788]|uniref:pyrimidine utilization protein D n=1 Tax=Azorhizobium sp. AG788 TaxID=2183897 RepID=UPI003138CEBB
MPHANGGDADLYYEVHGSGPAIVLSAGMGGSGAFWRPQLEALSRRHTVILYDHAGTGRSARDVGPRSIAEMARDITRVLDAAGIADAHVVGHAIGGIVGMELALAAPERVRSLTVVNGWGKADAFLRRCFEVRTGILRCSGPRAYVRAQPLFLYPPRWIAENIAALEEEEAHMVAHFPGEDTMLQRINTFLAFEGGARLNAIRVPTLLAAARDDALVPFYLSGQLARAIPGARLAEVDFGAHAFTAVTPDVFNAMLLDFCGETDR